MLAGRRRGSLRAAARKGSCDAIRSWRLDLLLPQRESFLALEPEVLNPEYRVPGPDLHQPGPAYLLTHPQLVPLEGGLFPQHDHAIRVVSEIPVHPHQFQVGELRPARVGVDQRGERVASAAGVGERLAHHLDLLGTPETV